MAMADAALAGRLRPGDHVCWSPADDRARQRLVTAYVRDGLRDHQRVLYLTDALCTAAALAELFAAGVDTASSIAVGRLRVATSEAAFLERGFDPAAALRLVTAHAEQARRDGFAGLRVLADMAWAARDERPCGGLAEYERQVNRVYATGVAMSVCLYDTRLFDEARLSQISRAHPATVSPGTAARPEPLLRMARTAGGLTVTGEADLSNRDALAAVLDHLLDDMPGPITLDLGGLAFADATACALIAGIAEEAPDRVRVEGARPELRKLLGAPVPA